MNSNFKNNLMIRRVGKQMRFKNTTNQSGATLVITLIVLLVLTVLAISSTNSNQSQALMVRNNQFRLEAFNTSYAEIDGQIDFVNNRQISDGVPDYLITLIDGDVGGEVSDTEAGVRNLLMRGLGNDVDYMDRSVAQRYLGECVVFGQQAGVGKENVKCNQLEIESDSDVINTNVGSNQFQLYEYTTLN